MNSAGAKGEPPVGDNSLVPGRRGRVGPSREGPVFAAWCLTWLGWGTLLVQQVADAAIHGAPWVIWLGKLLPLLLFLPGMLRDRLRSFIWLCFVCLLYFIALVEQLFALPGQILPMVGMLAVVVTFCAAMLYVRWRGRSLRLSRSQHTAGSSPEEN